MFKVNKSVKRIKYWLEEFQKTVNRTAGNQHLQFTGEIWTTYAKIPLTEKEDRDQLMTNNEFQFLDMEMGWYPEGDLQFGVFRKKGTAIKVCQKGKYPNTRYLTSIPIRSPQTTLKNHLMNTLPSL